MTKKSKDPSPALPFFEKFGPLEVVWKEYKPEQLKGTNLSYARAASTEYEGKDLKLMTGQANSVEGYVWAMKLGDEEWSGTESSFVEARKTLEDKLNSVYLEEGVSDLLSS